MPPGNEFTRFVSYEKKQLSVNKNAGYQCYAGTCYHAEQWAEKAIKEKMVEYSISYSKTHSVGKLVTTLANRKQLDKNDVKYTEALCAGQMLDDIYKQVLYPSEDVNQTKRITRKKAEDSEAAAKTVITWLASIDKANSRSKKSSNKKPINTEKNSRNGAVKRKKSQSLK